MQARKIDAILETFVGNIVYWLLMAFVIIAAITQLGVQTTSFIAVVGAAGLAIGLAMQGALSNFAAGVLIVLFRHYKVGDYIEAGGVGGSVEAVQILTTTLKTPDNITNAVFHILRNARLFRLPGFLVGSQAGEATAADVAEGFRLTGHFLERHLFAPHQRHLPDARLRLMEKIAARAG
jgi:hypothetical protein